MAKVYFARTAQVRAGLAEEAGKQNHEN